MLITHSAFAHSSAPLHSDSAVAGDRAGPSSHSAAAMAGKADHETMPTATQARRMSVKGEHARFNLPKHAQMATAVSAGKLPNRRDRPDAICEDM